MVGCKSCMGCVMVERRWGVMVERRWGVIGERRCDRESGGGSVQGKGVSVSPSKGYQDTSTSTSFFSIRYPTSSLPCHTPCSVSPKAAMGKSQKYNPYLPPFRPAKGGGGGGGGGGGMVGRGQVGVW